MENESKQVFRLQKENPNPDAKEYKLETIQDICDCVTIHNIDKFLSEFGIILRSAALAKSMNNNKPIKFSETTWIDD